MISTRFASSTLKALALPLQPLPVIAAPSIRDGHSPRYQDQGQGHRGKNQIPGRGRGQGHLRCKTTK